MVLVFGDYRDKSDRQIIMEQTWYCINDEAMKMVEETHDNKEKKSFKIKKSSSRRIVQQISDSDDQKVWTDISNSAQGIGFLGIIAESFVDISGREF